MKEHLLGYLCNALDDNDMRDVEAALADPQKGGSLGHELEVLRRAFVPLECDRCPLPAPPGLATRTLDFVRAHASAPTIPIRKPLLPSTDGAVPVRGPWLDRALLAASALAACVLVLPLVYESIKDSRARRVERNLQRVASALQGYGENHGILPTPPDGGPLSRAGLYAPTLVSEHRLLADDGALLVPDSKLAQSGSFRVPSREELEAAVGTPRFDELVRTMGGDFGYTLGHRCPEGRLQPNRDLRRAKHPILADAPAACCEKSDNHPDGFHYILFEDGHFERRHVNQLHPADDHLFRNRSGVVAAGVDPNDAVIARSHQQP